MHHSTTCSGLEFCRKRNAHPLHLPVTRLVPQRSWRPRHEVPQIKEVCSVPYARTALQRLVLNWRSDAPDAHNCVQSSVLGSPAGTKTKLQSLRQSPRTSIACVELNSRVRSLHPNLTAANVSLGFLPGLLILALDIALHLASVYHCARTNHEVLNLTHRCTLTFFSKWFKSAATSRG